MLALTHLGIPEIYKPAGTPCPQVTPRLLQRVEHEQREPDELLELNAPGARWYFQRARERPESSFSSSLFILALDSSVLNRGAKRTMLRTLETSNIDGITAASGRSIAADLNVRPATISDHWKQAEEAGLLLTRRRFNTSSLHQLCWPGSGICEPTPSGTPLYSRSWTAEELAWWNSSKQRPMRAPPWGYGFAPF